MAKEKFNLKSFLMGFKTILTKNGILIILLYICNQFGNDMKSGFRSFVGTDIGLTATVIGVAGSFYTLSSFFFRAPGGALTDKYREKLKYVLAFGFILKALAWQGFSIVNNDIGYYIVFLLDGIFFSFFLTALPAMLALTVDRKVMGSSYAIMTGLCSVAVSSARSLGISLYNVHGVKTAAMLSAVPCIIGAVLSLFLDCSQFLNRTEEKPAQASEKKERKLIPGVCTRMLPLCLVAGMPILILNGQTSFFNIYAKDMGFNYLGAQTSAKAIQGVLNIAIGFICDIVSPALLTGIALLGQAVAPLMWGLGTTDGMICASMFVYFITRYYMTSARIMGLKYISRKEQGAFSGTIGLCNDLVSIVGQPILGAAIAAFGYKAGFVGLGVWGLLGFAAFLILDFVYLKKFRENQIAVE